MNLVLSVVFFVLLFPYSVHAEANWDAVPVKRVQLFYPGTASWEYLVGKEHAVGAGAVIRGEKKCQDCHENEGIVNIRADEIVKGKLYTKNSTVALEPLPPVGIPGLLELEIQAAYDAENFYLKLKWPSPEGASSKDLSLNDKGLADIVSIQLNGNIKSFSKAGCFITCHDDMANMPVSPTEADVMAAPFYAKQKRRDVRHYTYYTRNKGWAGLKPDHELERYLKAEGFIDLWVAGFKGQEVVFSDESVLSDRIKDLSQDISAQGFWQGGFYTVVIERKLTTIDKMDIRLREGKGFYMGLAVYDNKNGNRRHYVSFPLSVELGGKKADVIAVKTMVEVPQAKESF